MEVKVHAWDPATGQRTVITDRTSPVTLTLRLPKGVSRKVRAEMSELRIAEVPEGWRKYSLREDDCGEGPSTVERGVLVNHCADILTKEDLGISGREYLDIVDFSID